MDRRIPLTALVLGIPPFVHSPQLREGETRFQFLVRHHPREWSNFIERMKNELGASTHTCSLLGSLNFSSITDPIVISKCEAWANHRLPTHHRTLESLSHLRKMLQDELGQIMLFDLAQILWPREKDPSGDTSAEKMASEMGAEVISLETGIRREMDLSCFLPVVKGKYLWALPGGSRFMAPLVALSLRRVLSHMEATPQVALYTDGSYSFIGRVSALASTAKKKGALPADLREMARILQADGFSLYRDSDPGFALCEIEHIFGLTHQYRGQLDEAERAFSTALSLEQEAGHLAGLAACHGNLGLLYRLRGDLAAAERHCQEALSLLRRLGDRSGEAKALGNLGTVAYDHGNSAEASALHREAQRSDADIGDRTGETADWANVALVQRAMGCFRLLWRRNWPTSQAGCAGHNRYGRNASIVQNRQQVELND
jgi:tetratricopeptide (TPR) repeat protein